MQCKCSVGGYYMSLGMSCFLDSRDNLLVTYLLVGNQKVFDKLIVVVSDIVDCLHTELLQPLSLQ